MLNQKLYKALGAVLVASSILITGCGGGEKRADVYLSRAQQYYDEGNYEKAKIEVKNVLQISPNGIRSRYLLGLIAEKEEDYRKAFQNFNAVIQMNPEHIDALNKVSFYFMAAKQFDGGRENAEKVLALEPENSEALSLMAIMAVQDKDFPAAKDYAMRSLAQDPNNVRAVRVLTAAVGDGENNLDQSLEIINAGIENNPGEASLLMMKVQVLGGLKRTDEIPPIYEQLILENPEENAYVNRLVNFYLTVSEDKEEGVAKAEALLRRQIAKKPEDDQLKVMLVQMLGNTNSVEVGISTLEEFVASSPDSELLRDSLANTYMAREEKARAEALYVEIIEQDPSSVASINARMKLVGIAFRENNKEEAERLIAEVLEIDAENTEALIARAKIHLAEKQYQEMIPDLRVALKNSPESEEALFLLATANERLGSTDLALDGYQALLSVNPGNLGALLGSGRILIARQQIEPAQKLLEIAMQKNPGNPEAGRLLATIYVQQQEFDKALSTAAQLIEREQTIALGYYIQGRVYAAQQDYKQAIAAFEKSQQADSRIIESLSALINSYILTEQYDVAIKYLQKHIEENPEHTNAQELLAVVYIRLEEFDKSIAILEQLVESQPRTISAYRYLSSLYQRKGDVKATEQLFITGIQKNPDLVGLYLLQAGFYQNQGSVDKAIDTYEAVLKQSPDSIVAKNNLASLLLDYRLTEANIKRAEELAQDLALTEEPPFLDTAGWVQFQLGNYPQALALIQLAVEKGGNSSVYQYHLGMAYYKNDMPSAAKQALSLAVAGEEDYPGKDEAEKVLAEL